ncbi:MAG TPA: hypothetical protein VFG89_01005 [Coriobacteriia bacterium]|nr:hypothetical protein [Coriobacteriia bacterium]
MNTRATDSFSWAFLDAVALWAAVAVIAVAVVGGVVTHGVAFAAACVVAGGIDVAVVHVAVLMARAGSAPLGISSRAAAIFIAGRLVIKTALLAAAWAFPAILSLAGTIAGVLVYDLTLTVLGSALAVRRSFGNTHGGTTEDGGAS